MNKIFHVTESFGGGVLTSIKNLTEVQSASNYKVFVVFLRRDDTPSNADLRLLFPDLELLEIGRSSLPGFLDLFLFVNRLMKKNREAIFHAHSSWAGVLVRIANIYLRTSRCFYTPHGYAHLRTDVSSSKRRFFQLSEIILNLTSKSSVISCGPTEALIATKLFSRSVIVSSNYLKDPFPESGEKVPHYSNDANKFRVATVGRITQQKGPERYLRITKRLADSVETEWIGSGAPGNLLAQNNMKITGWLVPEDISKKLANLDALLITSDWEGLSMVGLEALSHGVPIISWSYQGCEDLEKHGINGYFCYDEEEFPFYINMLFHDSFLMSKMKSNARRHFLENFDQKRLYQNWKELYHIETE